MIILGIESSCDETSISIFDTKLGVKSNIVSSQIKDHQKFGGVVPELAARKHLENIALVFHRALEQASIKLQAIDAIAVTNQPGLIGSLLVGVNFAKGLALALDKPIIPINHVHAHIFSSYLEQKNFDVRQATPFLALVISGGHTSLFRVEGVDQVYTIGQTLDDAIGEAFDKVAQLFDLGYPGGPVIEKLAKNGDAKTFRFPQIMKGSTSLDFSYSGLKTASVLLKKNAAIDFSEQMIWDFCAGFQTAAVELLLRRVEQAISRTKLKSIAISGGVSANHYIRDQFADLAQRKGLNICFPALSYTTDNAAMVASMGAILFSQAKPEDYRDTDFQAFSTM